MSGPKYKQPFPLQSGSITSIRLFVQTGLVGMYEIEYKLADVKDKTKDSKGFIHCYVDPTEKNFIHPDFVYRSNGLPRVKLEDVKTFEAHPQYKFIRFVGLIP
jgi:hypothetical protein